MMALLLLPEISLIADRLPAFLIIVGVGRGGHSRRVHTSFCVGGHRTADCFVRGTVKDEDKRDKRLS